MKLLAWMHQKLCRSINEQCKNSVGNTTLVLHAEQKDSKLMSKVEENGLKDDLFNGFLSIGTLGSDPPTPTFSTPFQDIKNEMERVNSELEKFLTTDVGGGISGGLSSPRSRQASVVSLTNMQQNGTDSDDFPLRKYLYGRSNAELLETVFENEDHCEKKRDSPDQATKQSYAMKFTKKVLKKLLHLTDNATKSGAMKRKLPKVPKTKFFPKKIHPSHEPIVGKPWSDANEEEITLASNQSHVHCAEKKKSTLENEIFDSIPYSETIYSNGRAEKRAHWITTEDDYLVLELRNENSRETLGDEL